ncbi:TPA: ornithine carbamoyltransferase [Methanocaldococcus jannaschii]|uniref:Ornithine carbamoyltransferase n=2 Tax=Methanocaldococcus jannaschii TaxID=2190 RepID=OTC_METJA|nr:ornithine carbamoyltransferase [Methanocaldococcus jannaschii]Q58291.1 RecName: Full=Ornithine carbamoyltransferase; Short=OTCase [Methanocaldococcus jannaschii DSM 2661]AAB98885.1 ornithine carbamoyltransferase (argF) [Methanocaldococcus jannaschii DSM 2661]HII59048.1 ornithine carbamoyltransferase [Methanocaldococcus jannaschii]
MHLLDLDVLSREDVLKIIEYGIYFKKNRRKHEKILEGKSVAILFEKPSTRTRMSFDIAVYELGGHPLIMNQNEIHLGKKESIKDTAKVMGRYVDTIVARVYKHRHLEEMAKYSSVPVINALSDLAHPCQILADLMTIKEYKGKFKGLKIAYLGDGNNVCNSLILGSALVGMDTYVGTPKGYEPNAKVVLKAKEIINNYGEGSLTLTNDPIEAAEDADVLYTDVWISMGDDKDKEEVLKIFPPFQINSKLLEYAKDDVIVMHCLPANRGYEITDDVIDGEHSVVYDEAENRLHVQKGVFKFIFERK